MIFLMLLKKSACVTDLSKNGLENALDSCVFAENLVFLGQAEIPNFQTSKNMKAAIIFKKSQMRRRFSKVVWER